MTDTTLNRRSLLKGAALTAGTAAFLQTALRPVAATAQTASAGTVHSFAKGGVTFHSYVSPAQTVHVTSHVIELGDQLLVVDATMLPDTAAELRALIDSTGKPVAQAYISHEHPDHWGGAAALENVPFATLPQIRSAIASEAEQGEFPNPVNVLSGPDLALGTTTIGGVPVEFRHYENNEAPHMIVAVLPEQSTAIVQDLVYNGVFFAPGVDRGNWIATLETLRDDPAFDTLLVGHGLPTTRGQLDTAISYVKVLDEAMSLGSPDEAVAMLKSTFPGHAGAFLLSLVPAYWQG